MDLRNKWVHFRVRDVYLPDPRELTLALHGNDLLQGKVLDLSDSGAHEKAYAVVEVEGVEDPVVVSVESIAVSFE